MFLSSLGGGTAVFFETARIRQFRQFDTFFITSRRRPSIRATQVMIATVQAIVVQVARNCKGAGVMRVSRASDRRFTPAAIFRQNCTDASFQNRRARYHFRAASESSALICRYRRARSRSARVRLTRYPTRGFEAFCISTISTSRHVFYHVPPFRSPTQVRVRDGLSDRRAGGPQL